MKPAAIRWFETLLFSGLFVDIGNNLSSAGQVSAGLAERGVAVSSFSLILLSLLPALVGVGFWYFIARRRNSLARWVLVLLVTGSSILFAVQLARYGTSALNQTLVLAGFSELLKLLAAACLFLPGTAPWFAGQQKGA